MAAGPIETEVQAIIDRAWDETPIQQQFVTAPPAEPPAYDDLVVSVSVLLSGMQAAIGRLAVEIDAIRSSLETSS
jgi:hypothetical protein